MMMLRDDDAGNDRFGTLLCCHDDNIDNCVPVGDGNVDSPALI